MMEHFLLFKNENSPFIVIQLPQNSHIWIDHLVTYLASMKIRYLLVFLFYFHFWYISKKTPHVSILYFAKYNFPKNPSIINAVYKIHCACRILVHRIINKPHQRLKCNQQLEKFDTFRTGSIEKNRKTKYKQIWSTWTSSHLNYIKNI